MKRAFVVMVALALLCLGGFAQALVMETVTVGDPGNVGDTRYDSLGCGSVSYIYNVGKYEVTAAQYCEFLNAKAKEDTYGLYHTYMWSSSYGCKIQQTGSSGSYTYSVASDYANRPVNYVSYWDSLRFANWLGNGQGNGDTETGAYTLDGYKGYDGRTIQRNANWQWAVTSEDEWYKAAYYKGGSANAGYWDYPMQSDISTTPSNDVTSPDGGNNASFNQSGYTIGNPYYRTNVGEFENSESAYGTFDQGGNVWEWNEAIPWINNFTNRGLRGGSFNDNNSRLQASYHKMHDPTFQDGYSGFRVSAVVPEPSSIITLLGGLVGLLGMRRRRA